MIVCLDKRLEDVVDLNAQPERIATGFRFTEGPLWNSRDQSLLFCDTFGHRLHRWTETGGTTVFRENSNSASGNTYDPQGRLLTCESRISKRVTRTLPDGTIEPLVTHYGAAHLSSPNDLVCLANGDVIFTDPPFGLRHSNGTVDPRETDCNGVYRFRKGELELLAGMEAPNGLVVRDGGKQLLVADTREHKVQAYDISTPGATRDLGMFVDVTHAETTGHPDGMKLDSLGNLYVAANTDEGLWVYSPEGNLLGFIGFDERPANCAWGGDDWQTLFVTAQTSVYRIRMKVKGQVLNPA